MDEYETNAVFKQLTNSLEMEFDEQRERAKREAFKPEPRSVPDGLIPKGIPFGHIALRGDFDVPPAFTLIQECGINLKL